MQTPFQGAGPPPTPHLRLPETGSTNADALRLAANGEAGPLWVLADRQTGGRGRSGRPWISPQGNLHATLLVTLWGEPREMPRLSLLAGVALWNAVAEPNASPYRTPGAGLPLQLKWPNDLLIGGAKCAGILIETAAVPSRPTRVAIGFGVNVASAPSIEGRPTTSLKAEGIDTAPADLLTRLDRAMRDCFERLTSHEGFADMCQGWLKRSIPLGSPLTVNAGNSLHQGTFAGLDATGALLLKTATGNLKVISHGDVSVGPNVG